MPILPGMWMWPGMMPILHSPGVITPGQFGPTSTVSGWVRVSTFLTRSMSSTGMPSVMQTMTLMPAAAASRMASAANGGGT